MRLPMWRNSFEKKPPAAVRCHLDGPLPLEVDDSPTVTHHAHARIKKKTKNHHQTDTNGTADSTCFSSHIPHWRYLFPREHHRRSISTCIRSSAPSAALTGACKQWCYPSCLSFFLSPPPKSWTCGHRQSFYPSTLIPNISYFVSPCSQLGRTALRLPASSGADDGLSRHVPEPHVSKSIEHFCLKSIRCSVTMVVTHAQ